ncbi:MAG: hypothetical protein ACJASY_001187 [Halioglobus sp.]|jgi:hypothetical protein
MITSFDDYCIHQTALPISEPSQSDRNFYDRYWFNGIEETQGDWIFEIGFGLYPNRRVMDGHFSVAMGNKQYAFHASRRAPKDRKETQVGPLLVEVIEPMRKLRVRLEPNEHDIECDLEFTAASIAHQEPANVMHDDGHLIMHNSRFTQMGFWKGYFSVDGTRYEVNKAIATRDRSWGVRPIGEPAGGAPGLTNNEPGVYWVWNPVNYGTFCTQLGTFEDRDGHPTQVSADLVPLYDNPVDIPVGDDPGTIEMSEVHHELNWVKGTRRAGSAKMHFRDKQGVTYDYTLETGQRFYMLGIGYNHFEWGHAYWKGELETGREEWNFDEINELDYQFIHTHQVVTSTLNTGGEVFEGVGTLESIVIGRHSRSGFTDFFDGAQ